MSPIISYLLEIVITLVICFLLAKYLNPFLRRILADLCGTEDRAQFWTAFTNILLVGLPMIIALAYRPESKNAEGLFFEITQKLSGNLSGFLIALVGAGLMISLFTLFTPRTTKTEVK